MNVLHIFSKSRGPRNLISRIFTVIKRFGISSKKFELLLKKYFNVMQSAGCFPTFAITAVVLKRHHDFIKDLSRQGVEFAIHGYFHIDYKVVSKELKQKHFIKAIDIFHRCQIPFVGFRAPFLRTNENTTPILSKLGFVYHSSRVIYWRVIDIDSLSEYAKNNHNRLLAFCTPLEAKEVFSLPKFENGLIEIPVSLPDDETIIERLGITDEKKIAGIWLKILQKVYDNGELFNLSLHPERIETCEAPLLETLRKAKGLNPSVWVTTLKEIAGWWRERASFKWKVTPAGQGKYKVEGNCSERATIIVKNASVNVPASDWLDGYQTIDAREFILESPQRPAIGVSTGSSPSAVDFIKSEGYIVEESDNPGDYGVYLNDLTKFEETDEKSLSRRIEGSGIPLLRYWRWPDKSRSAFSVTGDIDSMTITDFALRILENGWVNLCQRQRGN
jgi:hypothetical protein